VTAIAFDFLCARPARRRRPARHPSLARLSRAHSRTERRNEKFQRAVGLAIAMLSSAPPPPLTLTPHPLNADVASAECRRRRGFRVRDRCRRRRRRCRQFFRRLRSRPSLPPPTISGSPFLRGAGACETASHSTRRYRKGKGEKTHGEKCACARVSSRAVKRMARPGDSVRFREKSGRRMLPRQ
jgi:hypothetical protein